MTNIIPLSDDERGIVNGLLTRYSKVIANLASYVCRINNRQVIGIQDLYQAGYMGLILAIKNYKNNPKKLTNTYIIRCIKNEMCREANQFQDVFMINNQIKKILNTIAKARKSGLSDEQIAISLGFDRQKYKNYSDLLDKKSEEISEEIMVK